MTPIRTRVLAGVSAALVLLAFDGCSEPPKAEVNRLIALDVSGSAIEAGLPSEAKKVVGREANKMTGPGVIEFLAFSGQVGTAGCPDLKAVLTWGGGDTQFKDDKATIARKVVLGVDQQVNCVVAAIEKPSSDVLGAINEAASRMRALGGQKFITVVTDGCHSNVGLKLCAKATKVWDAAARKAIIDNLPTAWRPDLTGHHLCLVGIGSGANLEQQGVDGVRSFYSEFGQAMGAAYGCEG